MEKSTALTITEIRSETVKFFNQHWNEERLGTPPDWKVTRSPFTHDLFPYHDKGGCYALGVGREIIYIGIGNSLGSGQYEGYGIIRRLLHHVLKADPMFRGKGLRVVRDKWSSVTDVYTIGFHGDVEYIANSLEEFLIRRCRPQRNLSKSR